MPLNAWLYLWNLGFCFVHKSIFCGISWARVPTDSPWTQNLRSDATLTNCLESRAYFERPHSPLGLWATSINFRFLCFLGHLAIHCCVSTCLQTLKATSYFSCWSSLQLRLIFALWCLTQIYFGLLQLVLFLALLTLLTPHTLLQEVLLRDLAWFRQLLDNTFRCISYFGTLEISRFSKDLIFIWIWLYMLVNLLVHCSLCWLKARIFDRVSFWVKSNHMSLSICWYKTDLSSCKLAPTSWALKLATSRCLPLSISPGLSHVLPLLLVIIDSIYELLRLNRFLHDQLLRSLEIDVAELLNAVDSRSFHYHLVNILFFKVLIYGLSCLLSRIDVVSTRWGPLLFKPRVACLLQAIRFMLLCKSYWSWAILLWPLRFSILSCLLWVIWWSIRLHRIRDLNGLFSRLLSIIYNALLWYFIITSFGSVSLTRGYHISNWPQLLTRSIIFHHKMFFR